MELWHGSEVVVEHPSLDKCRQFNDYGRGFYCTPHEEMAMEWACRTESDGIANRYELDMDGLSVLDLESGEFSILNWLAILADNREFNVSTPLAREGLRYLIFLPMTSSEAIAPTIPTFRLQDSSLTA